MSLVQWCWFGRWWWMWRRCQCGYLYILKWRKKTYQLFVWLVIDFKWICVCLYVCFFIAKMCVYFVDLFQAYLVGTLPNWACCMAIIQCRFEVRAIATFVCIGGIIKIGGIGIICSFLTGPNFIYRWLKLSKVEMRNSPTSLFIYSCFRILLFIYRWTKNISFLCFLAKEIEMKMNVKVKMTKILWYMRCISVGGVSHIPHRQIREWLHRWCFSAHVHRGYRKMNLL